MDMTDKRTRNERNNLLAQAEKRIVERLDEATSDQVTRFLSQTFEKIGDGDILAMGVDALYGGAMTMWKLGERRNAGEAKVRVYNPRVEEHGWKCPHTVVEIVNDDMPFLVDSVTGYLNQTGHTVHLVIHPVIDVVRDQEGRRLELVEPSAAGADGTVHESVMHLHINERTDQKILDDLSAGLSTVLSDVRAAVDDWQAMLVRASEIGAEMERDLPVDEVERSETRDFLLWLQDNHFTFLGCRDFSYGDGINGNATVTPGSGLGILRADDRKVLTSISGAGGHDAAPITQQFAARPEMVLVTKTSVRGTVHRPVHMDYIGVKRFDEAGDVVGERRFVGLFTGSAYNEQPQDIPLIRRTIGHAIDLSGIDPSSHNGKALAHVLETFPRDELYQIDAEELSRIAMGILEIQDRPNIRLFVRRDKFDRYFSILVFFPRERVSTEFRRRVEEILTDSLNGRISAYYTQVGDSILARMHYIIGINEGGAPEDIDFGAIEQDIVQAARSWNDDLADALIEHFGEEKGVQLGERYGEAFPSAYAETFDANLAMADIDKIETLREAGGPAVEIYRRIEDAGDLVRFKIFNLNDAIPLSDCLPMLENMGLKVIGESPYRLQVRDGEAVWIHDFLMHETRHDDVDLAALKQEFEAAFERVWHGDMEDDGFNRLVLQAGLEWRDVVILRAYCKYLRQTGTAFSQVYMEDTLSANAVIAELLVKLFHLRFDTSAPAEREQQIVAIQNTIDIALEEVFSLDEDRILRRFLNLIQATLRTNFYQADADGQRKPYLSFKFDSQAILELPLPRPYREIFVYSPRVEGVHLRGGSVARGGLRWSDRREDFRTEVLGLMKAQMVKNAVIVPVGSKGGFVPKQLPEGGDREAMQKEAIECYKTFIRGMLDITDNLSGAEVLPPVDVVRHDDDDPYLVVAADKGTATFSDIANGVAGEYGFWLGDGFASGGAKGYDHKVMGITARGAWESVKRHFREFGRDIQNEEFTVIGIGDMSGDVFGNGMLLSKHIRLLAAFDHRHVFLDPDPDPARSWQERERLFKLPRSSWEDYDKELISEGGGIFERSAKSVELSPEIKALTGIEAAAVTPAELIHHLLQADVDLLWFGGIGTYVKAASESHDDVGDRANDTLRVNGGQLRCKVVGEGGNLGMTQLARIEFDANGGRVNSDAIDNSAGVDCSDHEVNIKILLDAIVEDGEMTGKQRDRLLEEMTDEVAMLVLQDNYLQTQALTMLEEQAFELLESHARYIRILERSGRLDRAVENLPDEETLIDRAAAGQGLTRPELAVLLAYAKMGLYDQLLDSDLTESVALRESLVKYFPRPLRKDHREAILKHRLRNEIIATVTANSIVNRLGLTFVHDVTDETGASAGNVARAYAAARELFGMRQIWNSIEELDNKVATKVQAEMAAECAHLMRQAILWFLLHCEQPVRISSVLEEFGGGIEALTGAMEDVLTEVSREAMAQQINELIGRDVPAELAMRIGALAPLRSGCDIVRVAATADRSVAEVGTVFFTLGARLGLDRLRLDAERLTTSDHWQRSAITSIIDDLYGQQRALSANVLRHADGAAGADAVENWCKDHARDVNRGVEMVEEFESAGGLDIAKLALANRYMRRLIVESS
jgi:glutamate dehydrogenase